MSPVVPKRKTAPLKGRRANAPDGIQHPPIINPAQYSADFVFDEVSTERQNTPPSFAVMNAELMRGRASHESQPSETYELPNFNAA